MLIQQLGCDEPSPSSARQYAAFLIPKGRFLCYIARCSKRTVLSVIRERLVEKIITPPKQVACRYKRGSCPRRCIVSYINVSSGTPSRRCASGCRSPSGGLGCGAGHHGRYRGSPCRSCPACAAIRRRGSASESPITEI